MILIVPTLYKTYEMEMPITFYLIKYDNLLHLQIICEKNIRKLLIYKNKFQLSTTEKTKAFLTPVEVLEAKNLYLLKATHNNTYLVDIIEIMA